MPEPLGLRIAGTGHALPSRIIDNKYFAARLDTSDEWIVSRTGIRERRIAGAHENTSDMAARAGAAATVS